MATSKPIGRKHGSAGSTRSEHSSSNSSTSQGSRSNSASSVRKPLDTCTGKSSKVLPKPSDKLNPKTVDPFSSKGGNGCTPFASMYSNGSIPCRLVHGSVKHKLNWNTNPDLLSFDPLIVTFSEGLREKIHPYAFVARTGFKDLLLTTGANDKARPLLSKMIPPLRLALGDRDNSVFEAGLEALVLLSDTVTFSLNPHLKMILVPVSKRGMEKKYKEQVMEAMQKIESNGGKEAYMAIKSKMPTYISVAV